MFENAKRKAEKKTGWARLNIGQYEPNGNVSFDIMRRGEGNQWGGVGFSLSRKEAKELMKLLKKVVR